jgi:hypothetical protein
MKFTLIHKKVLIKTLTIFTFLLLGSAAMGQITIGSGTSTQRYPLGNYFGYERSASLYTSTEIGSSGIISNKSQLNFFQK